MVVYWCFLLILFGSLISNQSQCSKHYKPVILVHGFLTGNESMGVISERIQLHHPGTVIYNTASFGGWSSLDRMWYQVDNVRQEIQGIFQKHHDGVHLLGYSQGGLLARGVLQVSPNHTVHKFISLSSPQAGQYGTNFLRLIFPNLTKKTIYEVFYSKIGQHTSVGNYWNDPNHQDLYYKYSEFLPFLNNAIPSEYSDQFKAAILKLKRLILIGGPADQVIAPWESSQFGFYADGINQTVVTLMERDIYKKDLIGLKTLMDSRRLSLITVPGMQHFMWHLDTKFIDQYLVPLFD